MSTKCVEKNRRERFVPELGTRGTVAAASRVAQRLAAHEKVI